jgi:hypothetical protein
MNGKVLTEALLQDSPLLLGMIEGTYASNSGLQKLINDRGI